MRSIPGANAMRLWSFSLAALMKVNRPAIPNWSVTIPDGILDTMPVYMIGERNITAATVKV